MFFSHTSDENDKTEIWYRAEKKSSALQDTLFGKNESQNRAAYVSSKASHITGITLFFTMNL